MSLLCPACHAPLARDARRCSQCGLAPESPAIPLSPPRPGVPPLSSPPAVLPLGTPPPGTDPYLGTVVAGRFRVDELIGSGGMGKVYRATHLGLDKPVCLKTLKPGLADDPTIVGRFEREAKAASRLDHPNSIQVLDFGQDERGNLFLVMEFVQGRDLRRLLRDQFPLPESRVVHLLAQVLAALARAHAQGVIHRDLKPENVLVFDQGDEKDVVKVLDFGIAKVLDPNAPGLTRSDVVCGTPEYMSPEQAMGKPIDARADLYAVGVVLHQCFAGALPFDGANAMQILQKQVGARPRPVHEVFPQATSSPAMDALILRALEKDPARRPQTAEAFRRELLSVVGVVTPAGPTASPPATLADDAPTDRELHRLPEPPSLSDLDLELAGVRRSRLPLFAAVVGLLALALAAYAVLRTGQHPYGAAAIQEPLKPATPGGLSQEQAYAIIESHENQVVQCFHWARRRIRETTGEVVLSLAIGGDGRVTRANISQSSLDDARLERCLTAHALRWTFPPPQRPPMMMSYAYRFRPG